MTDVIQKYFTLILLVLYGAFMAHSIWEDNREIVPDKSIEVMIEKPLNRNPGLTLGKCPEAKFGDAWGQSTVDQCFPNHYTLYQVHINQAGVNDSGALYPTTVPILITYNGKSYTFYPFGRAGDIGFTSPIMQLQAGCYKIEVQGYNNVIHKTEFLSSLSIRVGSDQRESKSITGNGEYSYAWFFNAESEMSVPITFYANFPYGNTVTGESWLTITDFKVVPVSIGHCG